MGYTETSDAHCVELSKEQSAITALKAIKAGELDSQTGYERTIQLLRDLGYEKIANIIQKNILEDEIQHEAILTEIIKGLSKIDATNIEKGVSAAGGTSTEEDETADIMSKDDEPETPSTETEEPEEKDEEDDEKKKDEPLR
jgi:hypothetical protein